MGRGNQFVGHNRDELLHFGCGATVLDPRVLVIVGACRAYGPYQEALAFVLFDEQLVSE